MADGGPQVLPGVLTYPPAGRLQTVTQRDIVRLLPITGSSATPSTGSQIETQIILKAGDGFYDVATMALTFFLTNASKSTVSSTDTQQPIWTVGTNMINRLQITSPSGGVLEDIRFFNRVVAANLMATSQTWLDNTGSVLMGTKGTGTAIIGSATVPASGTRQFTIPLVSFLLYSSRKMLPMIAMSEDLTVRIFWESPTIAVTQGLAASSPTYTNAYSLSNIQLVVNRVRFEAGWTQAFLRAHAANGGLRMFGSTWQIFQGPITAGSSGPQTAVIPVPVRASCKSLIFWQSLAADQVANLDNATNTLAVIGWPIFKMPQNTLTRWQIQWGAAVIPQVPVNVTYLQYSDCFAIVLGAWALYNDTLRQTNFTPTNYIAENCQAQFIAGADLEALALEGPNWWGNSLNTKESPETMQLLVTWSGQNAGGSTQAILSGTVYVAIKVDLIVEIGPNGQVAALL